MILTNEKIFLYSLYALGAVVWYVLWKFLGSLVGLLVSARMWGPLSVDQWMMLTALVVSLSAVQLVWKNQKAKEYGVEVVVETKKVSWPNRKELQGSTLVVIVMVILVTVIIYLLDKIFDNLVRLLFQI